MNSEMVMDNKERLATFFTSERKKLVSYVGKKTRQNKDREPEDLVQDVFVALMEGVLHPIENLAAYVYRSLDNRLTDLFRRKSSTELSYDALEAEDSAVFDRLMTDLRSDTVADYERKELMEQVYEAIDHLPEAQKSVLVATEIEGWTFEDLSELWEEPIGTLLSRKHRAVQTLRKKLKKLL